MKNFAVFFLEFNKQQFVFVLIEKHGTIPLVFPWKRLHSEKTISSTGFHMTKYININLNINLRHNDVKPTMQRVPDDHGLNHCDSRVPSLFYKVE